MKQLLLILCNLFFYFDISEALPAHRRLWEKKYNYANSCTLCHSKGGGSQLNSYGEDFQRFGMSPGAFVTIEKRDSDHDGVVNIDEIRAKSNPGDFTSNPQSPTDWLSRIEESMLPFEDLKKIFPESLKFSALEGTLYSDQIKQIEQSLNISLSEADSVPTFYFAIKEQEKKHTRVGVVIFSVPSRNSEKLIIGIGVDLSGKIKNVILVKNKYHKDLESKFFLDQFKEKNLMSSFQINKDIKPANADLILESELVIDTIKKSLSIIQIVFNKNKKTLIKEAHYEFANIKKNCFDQQCSIDRFINLGQ